MTSSVQPLLGRRSLLCPAPPSLGPATAGASPHVAGQSRGTGLPGFCDGAGRLAKDRDNQPRQAARSGVITRNSLWRVWLILWTCEDAQVNALPARVSGNPAIPSARVLAAPLATYRTLPRKGHSMAAEFEPGNVVNGHVLSTKGDWHPLRLLPPNAPAPFQAGDVVNGHVFTGDAWVLYAYAGPAPFVAAGRPVKSKRSRLFARLGFASLGVLVVALIVWLVIYFNLAAGPEKQAGFVAAVQAGQSAPADNGAQIIQAKVARGSAICDVLPGSLKVKGWQGTVAAVTDELGGDEAILTIQLAKGIKIEADTGLFATGIKPGTNLYGQVAQLSKGQSVTFSGKFQQDKTYCIKESSILDENGLRTPTFAFKFSDVQ
jgi:hypothetical protein